MQIVALILGLLLFASFYLPVYLPFLISFRVKSSDYREVRWALRLASAACLFLAVIPPPGLRYDFGNDVGGNFARAGHNFPIMFARIWGGGLACIGVCLLVGFIVRLIRHRRSNSVSEETAR